MDDQTLPSPIDEVSLNDVPRRLALGDYKVLKITTSLDLDDILKTYHVAINAFGLNQKDKKQSYKGICLQYKDGEDKYFGGLDRYEANKQDLKIYHKKNEIGLALDHLFYQLAPLTLTRGRFLKMHPGFHLATHSDNSPRLHIALFTAPTAVFQFDKDHYHIPADGHAYVINTCRQHSYQNALDTERVHLIFDVGQPHQIELVGLLDELLTSNQKKVVQTLIEATPRLDNFQCQSCSAKAQNDVLFIELQPAERLLQSENYFLVCDRCRTDFTTWLGNQKPGEKSYALKWLKQFSNFRNVNERVRRIIEAFQN